MRFQSTQRTERQPAQILLQFANIVPAQAYIMDEISRALKIGWIDLVKFLAKMLLCLQHLTPDWLEPRDDRLDFESEVLPHRDRCSATNV